MMMTHQEPKVETNEISNGDLDRIHATAERLTVPPSLTTTSPDASGSVFTTQTFDPSPTTHCRAHSILLDNHTSHTTTSSPRQAQRRATVDVLRSVSDHPQRSSSLAWETPTWAKERRLRPTAQGAERTPIEWQKPDWTTQPILKESHSGHLVKTKGDLQKPITKATDKDLRGTADDFNPEATPLILRPTQQGSAVRLGKDLAKRITMVEKDPFSDVNFEANPTFVLRDTYVGQAVKQGTCLSKPVTHCPKPESMGVNFTANPIFLKPTLEGKLVKTKGDLQKPITSATVTKSELDSLNFEANPMILRPTVKGSLVRLGEKLERPITHIKEALAAEPSSNAGGSPPSGMEQDDGQARAVEGRTSPSPCNQEEADTVDRAEDLLPWSYHSDRSGGSHGALQWEEFASREEGSESGSVSTEEASYQESMEAAFDHSFGRDGSEVLVDS